MSSFIHKLFLTKIQKAGAQKPLITKDHFSCRQGVDRPRSINKLGSVSEIVGPQQICKKMFEFLRFKINSSLIKFYSNYVFAHIQNINLFIVKF